MGRIAAFAGMLEMVIGICFLVVILFFIGLLLQVPSIILEIIMLYRAYEYVKAERLKEMAIA